MAEVCVRVAVRIRPLLPKEVLRNHKVAVRAVPGSSQVMLNSDKIFPFDHVFGPAAGQDEVYESCVRPLVESLLDGHNATVFCYGQTGSGKTFTLGGGQLDEEGGIMDRVAQDVFALLGEKMKNSGGSGVTVRVSHMELYKEKLRDLLEPETARKEILIREDEKGNTVVVGVREEVVTSAQSLLHILEFSNTMRHTGSTRMNEHSSRSHTIFTLQLIQRCHNNGSPLKPARSSKLCLVDLAGSERATGNNAARLKESVHINAGLLALGNVIRALCDSNRFSHVPYRDAKITRLLRDSLGGTAHTLMVACVNPSDRSLPESMSVLQFASKARHIRNRPGAICSHKEMRSCPPTWDPSEARLCELEFEVQTLRELLKEKEREVVKERAEQRVEVEDNLKQLGQRRISDPHKKGLLQYYLLAQEASVLFTDLTDRALSLSVRQRVQRWQEMLTAANQSHQADYNEHLEGDGDQTHYITISTFKEELNKCKAALTEEKKLKGQNDAEVRQALKQAEELYEEEKERTHIQAEQLLEQQILIGRLQSELISFKRASLGTAVKTGASGNSDKRPHSVPLMRHSCGHGPLRRIHSSPPACSLERVMAAFKMRGHLLLAENDEKDEVSCPFIKQTESKDRDQERENDVLAAGNGFRRSINRTWTSRQKLPAVKEKNSGVETSGTSLVQKPGRVTGTRANRIMQSQTKKARQRASVTQRRIHDLSINMRMKEELIKELDKTDKETQAVERQGWHSADGGEANILVRLSMQRQQIQAEVYHSLEHMRLQRAELHRSLSQLRETSEHREGLNRNWELKVDDLNHQEESKRLRGSSWLEEEEERVLQKRAELQELEAELRRRGEVLLQREACLQQKNKLEIKMLRSSQDLSQDLMHVSVQLESVEKQLQSSVRLSGGVTIEELEKERDMLKKRRDSLDVQLKDSRVLTVEEENSLFQLEEAIEALDAALEFKNNSIQNKQKSLFTTELSSQQSHNTEPAKLCDVIRKLKLLSPPEASELLAKYFNKVVCLREAERCLRLRCEELELNAEEQEGVVRELEVAMQRLALDADRRLTQQHRDHQNNIQLLLQKLKEGVSGETQQAIHERLQHLEKELFFYKSTSRQLKKKLRELVGGAQHPEEQPPHTPEHKQTHTHFKGPQQCTEEAQTRTHIVPTYTKINAEQVDNAHVQKSALQTPCLSSSDLHSHKNTKMNEYCHMHTQSQGASERMACPSEESLKMAPVRLCRRDLRQIPPADLQARSSATRRSQFVVETSTDSILEDSIEVSRNTDR